MVGTTRQFIIAIVLASLVGIIATACLAAANAATAATVPMTVIAPQH